MSDEIHHGSCLCGGVEYSLTGPMRPVVACHCTQCQKTSGFHAAMTQVDRDRLSLKKMETLAWYASSDVAERGFCNRCGGNLFWRRHDEDTVSVTAGTLNPPTGLKIDKHIFTETAGDYYEIWQE